MIRDKIFAVFGLGRFGYEICKVLSEKGAKVIAIDNREKIINKIKDTVTQAVLMDSTEEDALNNAGMQDVDVAIVAIGDNIDSNILTTTLLKNLGVPYIISRAINEIHAQVLKQIGATEVINIEIDEGNRLANRLVAPDVMDLIPVSDKEFLIELRIPKEFVGKTLIDLDLRKRFNVNIVSIKRYHTEIDAEGNPEVNQIVISPKPDQAFRINDIIVILGEEKNLQRIKEL